MNEAMVRHSAPLVLDDEAIIRELWAFPETIELLARWEASEARRLANGTEAAPKTIASLTRNVDEIEARAREFQQAAMKQIGDGNPIFNDQIAAMRTGIGGLVRGAGLIAHQAGEKERAVEYLQRARSWPASDDSSSTSLQSVHPLFWPDGARRTRTEQRNEFVESVPGIAAKVRPGITEPIQYIGGDEELSSKLTELKLGADPSLAAFASVVAQKFFAGPASALQPYFGEGVWNEGEVAALARPWTGWTVKEQATHGTVREYEPNHFEVHLEGLLLANEAGDLWWVPFDLLVDRTGAGRYSVIDLRSLLQREEEKTPFDLLLKKRLEKVMHQRKVKELIERGPIDGPIKAPEGTPG